MREGKGYLRLYSPSPARERHVPRIPVLVPILGPNISYLIQKYQKVSICSLKFEGILFEYSHVGFTLLVKVIS